MQKDDGDNIIIGLILALVIIASVFLILIGQLFWGSIFLVEFVLIILAIYSPTSTIILLLGITVLPWLFQFVPWFKEDYNYIGNRLVLDDVILVPIAIAFLYKAIHIRFIEKSFSKISKVVIIFLLWIAFEMIRNIPVFGISVYGEFRGRFLLLFSPFYVALYFDTIEKRKNIFKALICLMLLFPLLFSPIIYFLRGGELGYASKIYGAEISLGMSYGIIALFLSIKYQLIKFPKIIILIIAIPTLVLIIADSHRSVWLALIAALSVMIVIVELRNIKIAKWILPVMFVGIISVYLLSIAGVTMSENVINRATEVTDIGEGASTTAAWRFATWIASLEKIVNSPLIGEGIGGYWEIVTPDGSVQNYFPHNQYIAFMVKLGLIGLIIYLIIIRMQWKILLKSLHLDTTGDDQVLIRVGLIVLFSSHIFYIAYGFTYYSLIMPALGFSSALYSTTPPAFSLK